MKYILPILIVIGIYFSYRLFTQLRDIGKQKEKPAQSQTVKSPEEKAGVSLETPKIGADAKEKEEDKPMQLASVKLENVTADQLLLALGDKISQESSIQVLPSASNDGVIVTGQNLQHVVTYAELFRQYDQSARLVTVNAVVGRLIRGKGLRVGLYDILKQSAADSAGSSLASLLRDVQWNLVTGVATFGTAYEARLAISLITDFEASRYQFEVVSRPSVTILSGQAGLFSSGREIPVPVTTQNVSGAQTSIQYKQAEFRFQVTPTVRRDGTIRLRVEQGNSDVLSSSEIGGDSVPVLSTQQLKTVMDLQPSEMAYLGGIRVRSERDDNRGVPLLGEVPGLNMVFGTKDKGREESELVILISVDVHQKGETPVQVRKAVAVGGSQWLNDTATLSPKQRAGESAKHAAKEALKKSSQKKTYEIQRNSPRIRG